MRKIGDPFLDNRIFDIGLRMAFRAIENLMRTGKNEAGFRMIERFLIERKGLRIDAEMFLVAGDARAAVDGEMVTVSGFDLRLDLRVTAEAFGADDLLADFMAADAILRSFQRRMPAR